MGKILVCGDVHGRQFWKEPCSHTEDYDKIVFLGDYLSPYPTEGITNSQAIEVFKEVLEFKKANPDKVILLFGNHDASNINTELCECRTDHQNWSMLNTMFLENIKLFDLAWETKIGDKRYFFSHSGVRKYWFDNHVKDKWFKWDGNELPPADYFNNVFHAAYDEYNRDVVDMLEEGLSVYSSYRGWFGEKAGSIIWADILEYSGKPEYEDVMFICGHTQLKDKAIISEHVADLDVRMAFEIDEETGKIEEYGQVREDKED